jgi:hypothetical protein
LPKIGYRESESPDIATGKLRSSIIPLGKIGYSDVSWLRELEDALAAYVSAGAGQLNFDFGEEKNVLSAEFCGVGG